MYRIELGIHLLNGRTIGDEAGEFTNFTENGCSTVDYMLTEPDMFDVVESFTVLNVPEANHLPLNCILKLSFKTIDEVPVQIDVPTTELKKLKRFKWKQEERDYFVNKLTDETSAETLMSIVDDPELELDDAVDVFTNVLHRAGETMEVKSGRRPKKCSQPKWWDDDCKRLKKENYVALQAFRETNNEAELATFKDRKRDFKNLCKQKSLQWKSNLRESLVLCRSNPTMFWKKIKSISGEHSQPSDQISAAEWFKYFEGLLNQEVRVSEEFKTLVEDFTTSHDTECHICAGQDMGSEELQELNELISTDEILWCINNMSNGKAPGVDGIVIEMIKCSSHVTVPYLKHMYNKVLVSGNFPKQWCQAVLAPLHKKGPKNDPSNYRGIALLSVLGKIFTKILNERLVTLTEKFELQREEQAGFRKGYSTTDNIFTLQSLIQKYCSRKGGRFYVVFVDFSKAFDTIPHSMLFYQLMSKGVHGKVLNVLRSMYASLESCVRTPGGITDSFKCSVGTRQGCMLSPCLFSLYVGELVTMLDEADCMGVYLNEEINIASLLFADDVAAGADTVGRLQKEIDVIANFCHKWGLQANLSKTKVMVFRNGGPLRQNEKWFYNGVRLEVVSAYKYLGSMFTPKLVWSLCQKTLATQALRGLFLITKYNKACDGLPVPLQFELFDKMIAPMLLYSSEIWGFAVAKDIERIQTSFCRRVLGVPSHTSTRAVLAETGRLPMYVKYFKRCVNYWLKVIEMSENRYPNACYKMLYQLDLHGRTTWASSVRLLLTKYGFHDVWVQQGVGNKIAFFREFSHRVKMTYIEEWEYDVSQSSKLSLFRSLKSNCTDQESYLLNVNLWKYRSGIAKLRCSAHTLRIEKGRHVNELVADRVCKLCTKNDNFILEDEYHFILCCPAFVDLRITYLPELAVAQPSYNAFIELLKDDDATNQRNMAQYIFHASKLRGELLKDLL